jgi:hypothetical protein
MVERNMVRLEGDGHTTTCSLPTRLSSSLYRALLGKFALSQDAALDLVRENLATDSIKRFILSRVARSELFRRLFVSVWKRQDEPYVWAHEFPEADAYIAIDVTRRGLVDWYADQSVPARATSSWWSS